MRRTPTSFSSSFFNSLSCAFVLNAFCWIWLACIWFVCILLACIWFVCNAFGSCATPCSTHLARVQLFVQCIWLVCNSLCNAFWLVCNPLFNAFGSCATPCSTHLARVQRIWLVCNAFGSCSMPSARVQLLVQCLWLVCNSLFNAFEFSAVSLGGLCAVAKLIRAQRIRLVSNAFALVCNAFESNASWCKGFAPKSLLASKYECSTAAYTR